MSIPILSSIFGEKPNIADYHPIDFGESQLKSILANLKAFPKIQELGNYFQDYMTKAYDKAIPNFSKLLEMGGESAESILEAAKPLIHGQIPQDVLGQLMRSGAFKALGKGPAFIQSLQGRDILDTSLGLMQKGAGLIGAAGSATQQWANLADKLIMNPAAELITPRDQANLDLQQNLIQREVEQARENVKAAPDPIAKGLSDLVAYLTASYLGSLGGGGGAAGKPPAAVNYSAATGVGSESYGMTPGGMEVTGPSSFQEIPVGEGWGNNAPGFAQQGNLQAPVQSAGGPFGGITGWNDQTYTGGAALNPNDLAQALESAGFTPENWGYGAGVVPPNQFNQEYYNFSNNMGMFPQDYGYHL